MKKILLIFTAALLLFALTSCGLIFSILEDETDEPDQIKNGKTVEFNGDSLVLDYETHHGSLFYKIDLPEMHTDTVGSFCNVSYMQEGDVAFDIRLVYYAGKTVDEVMDGSEYVMSEKTVNGLTYKYFEYVDNDRPGHTYVYNFDGTTYTLSFVSAHDMTSLENGFLEAVRFDAAE